MEGIDFSQQEKKYFKQIFDFWADEEVDDGGSNVPAVSAVMAKEMFPLASVNSQFLKQIWSLSANKKRHLLEDDFMCALKYISIVQANDNLDDLSTNWKIIHELPKFEHEQIEKFRHAILTEVQNQSDKIIGFDEEYSESDEETKYGTDDTKATSVNQTATFYQEEEKVSFSDRPSEASTFSKQSTTNEENKENNSLEVSIPKFETISQGFMGYNSYTQYKIVTIPRNISTLMSGNEYIVWRRFSDFEWMHSSLISQDEYKGLVIPSLPDKSYLSRQDDDFCESRRIELNAYVKSLCEHKVVRNSRSLHLFLTTTDEEEFSTLKLQDSTLQERLFEYAQKIRNFDMDHLVTNISQYFDSEEPDEFMLAKAIKSHMEALLGYEGQITKMIAWVDKMVNNNSQLGNTMSHLALGIEKFRLKSETTQLSKLFTIGDIINDEDIEDLDNTGMSRFNSKESDPICDEYDKIERTPFMKNTFPALKWGCKAVEYLNENWKTLSNALKTQLSKIQGLKNALERRSSTISDYKTNLTLIKKKKLKQESAYNYENLHIEIETMEETNRQLKEKIFKVNKDLSEDLAEFSLSDNVSACLSQFLKKHKEDKAQKLQEVIEVENMLKAHK